VFQKREAEKAKKQAKHEELQQICKQSLGKAKYKKTFCFSRTFKKNDCDGRGEIIFFWPKASVECLLFTVSW